MLLDYTNLFSPDEYESDGYYITKIFSVTQNYFFLWIDSKYGWSIKLD